jgi:hypothetical protein
LLLALIDIPDFGAMMARIAGGVERIAGRKPTESSTEPSGEEGRGEGETHDYAVPLAGETQSQHVEDKDLTHA